MFNLDLITDMPSLKRIEIDGARHYVTEGGETVGPYPSVTTILSSDKQSQKKLQEWRNRVGEEEAAKISYKASTRGSIIHEMIEDYLQDKLDLGKSPFSIPLNILMFNALRDVADAHINNIRMIEGQMISKHLRVAGTVDLVAEFDGVLSIIDWKTSAKKKKKAWIKNYFIQESAYAVMFEELTGIPVPQIVTVITNENGTPQVFVEKRDNWIDSFIQLRDTYELELQSLS